MTLKLDMFSIAAVSLPMPPGEHCSRQVLPEEKLFSLMPQIPKLILSHLPVVMLKENDGPKVSQGRGSWLQASI